MGSRRNNHLALATAQESGDPQMADRGQMMPNTLPRATNTAIVLRSGTHSNGSMVSARKQWKRSACLPCVLTRARSCLTPQHITASPCALSNCSESKFQKMIVVDPN